MDVSSKSLGETDIRADRQQQEQQHLPRRRTGGSRRGDRGGSGSWGDGGAGKGRGRCILDGVQSDTAAVEVGGGPWTEAWVGSAEMREPLGTLAGAPVDVDAVAGFFKRVGLDVVPGL